MVDKTWICTLWAILGEYGKSLPGVSATPKSRGVVLCPGKSLAVNCKHSCVVEIKPMPCLILEEEDCRRRGNRIFAQSTSGV